MSWNVYLTKLHIQQFILYAMMCVSWTTARVIEANLESSVVCDRSTPYKLQKDDLIVGFLEPRRAAMRRTSCTIRATALDGHTVVVRTKSLKFQGCGDHIKIFDQQRFLKNPIYNLDCDSSPNTLYKTDVSEAMVEYTKASPETTSVLEFWIMTDNSEWLNKDTRPGGSDDGDTRNTLTAGAIAGIAVACVLVAGFTIGLSVYCYRAKTTENLHDYY